MSARSQTIKPLRVALLGFGHLGRFLYDWTNKEDSFEIVCIYNRGSNSYLAELSVKCPGLSIVSDGSLIDTLKDLQLDLVVEVSHPDVVAKYGVDVLSICDFMVGSPVALADEKLKSQLLDASRRSGRSVYIPCGALWGCQDIRRMADDGSIQSLCITMRKHPSSIKLIRNHVLLEDDRNEVVIYNGSVREICTLAPNNVNTMAAGAIAAHTLGFDGTIGILVADKSLEDYHVIEVEVFGKKIPGSKGHLFHCFTRRVNPAPLGQVTGQATFVSFANSLKGATGKGPGIHLC